MNTKQSRRTKVNRMHGHEYNELMHTVKALRKRIDTLDVQNAREHVEHEQWLTCLDDQLEELLGVRLRRFAHWLFVRKSYKGGA